MKHLVVVMVALVACKNPPPECAPRGETYEICSDDRVWTCPEGPADVVAFNLAQDEACNDEPDPIQCTLDADYEYVEMELSEDCVAADQVCVEAELPATGIATCEDPAS